MSDARVNGRRFRTFNVIDDFNRETLASRARHHITYSESSSGAGTDDGMEGCPAKLPMENNPELVSVVLSDWAEKRDVVLEFTHPGKPTHNSYIERFNRTFRRGVLDFYVLNALREVRETVEAG